MKIKTSELSGNALDYAVALCEDARVNKASYHTDWLINADRNFMAYAPSSDWSQGGPIIDREKINIKYDNYMWGGDHPSAVFYEYAKTPLIAAMCCYVASKIGDCVDIPDSLINN